MRVFKNIAMTVAACMLVTSVPAVVSALPDEAVSDTTPSVGDTVEATATPEVTSEPTAVPTTEPTPEVTEDPSITPEPTAEASETPTSTAVPTSKPNNGKYSVTVEQSENSEINVTPASAAKGTVVTVEGAADRGYGFERVSYVYSENGTENETTLFNPSGKVHSVDKTFRMPEADVVIKSQVSELTDREVVSDAETQIQDVKALNSEYTSRYINNSSDYNSSDISDMRSYIREAQTLITDLDNAKDVLYDAVQSSDLTANARENVISIQTELDALTNNMKDLAAEMGGEDVENFDLSVSVGKGGRVVISGLVSDTLNATSVKKEGEYTEITTDGTTGLSFTVTAATGYSLSSFRINNKSISVTGNKVNLRAATLGSYVRNGLMDVTVTFSYTGFGSGSGGSTGGSTGGTNTGNNQSGSGITASSVYSDLDTVQWAQESIEALSNLGIVSGMGDGTFAPNSNVTREQFAKMIVGVMGYSVDPNAETDFVDANGEWYTPYIAAAVQNGIITGRGDGSFGVGENITRQDMAVIIYRAMGLSAGEVHEFADSAEISDYAVDAVSALYNANIIGGYPDGTFAPKANASRAEASKMLYSVYNAVH